MKPNTTPFPWHYYIRIIRSRIILVILSSVLTYIACQYYEESLFTKILSIILFFIIFSVIQGFFRILPVRDILSKIDKIQIQLPHDKKLNIIYQKSEWVLIQEMLKLTEKYIREQSEYIKSQEQQSHTLVESIPEGVIVLDEFFNCKHYNNIFREKFIHGKEITLYEDEKLWKIFDDNKIIDAFQTAKNQGKVVKLKGHLIEQEYYNISITPVLGAKEISILGIFHNITESILSEKMRVDFVANVSHEIRTPLTSIRGFSQLLLAQKDICPSQLHTPLERIVYNTERLKDLFDGLLNLSVIESKFEIEKKSFDFSSLLRTISSNIKAKYPEKELLFEIDSEEHIYGDRKLLEQVFTNLIDNSVKYSKKEQVTIKVSHFYDPVINSYTSEIQDNGPGIGGNDIKRIFERFYRVQGHATSAVEGSGLGLSIVKHIINKHNGIISVDSKIGTGTSFTIKLPKQ